MNATSGVTQKDIVKDVAHEVLEDRIAEVLVGRDEPAKTGEVMRALSGEGITMRFLRRTLAGSDRFTTLDRRWMLSSRIEDTQRPFERIVERIFRTYGHPMTVEAMARELAYIFERPAEHYESVLPRLLSSGEKYFQVGEAYGLADWLLHPTSDEMDDVIFDNFLSEDQVEQYKPFAEGVDWSKGLADGLVALLDKAGEPVPMKIAALFAWRGLESDYDAVEFYSDAVSDDRMLLLSDQRLVGPKIKSQIGKAIADVVKEVEALPLEPGEEAEGGPVEVTDADREEAVNMIVSRGGAVSSHEILENVLEVMEGESEFESGLEKLGEALKADERVVWVGDSRWRPAGTLPEDVYEVPPALIIPPRAPFETPEGDIYDQELEDDGLDASLKAEIPNPLVEDVGDEDMDNSMVQPNDPSQRCVLKYHHKEAGTFPLCQINPEFFGTEPELIQVTLVDEGVRRDVWVNNTTRLIYNMKDWYQGDWPVSGGVFYIEKTNKPGEYRFSRSEENDPMVYVPNARLFELLELKNEAETSETPVFDIITRIMDQHKKGVGFVTLFTEANLVKRVNRRLVASILSSYHAFYLRPKSTEWQYDTKKRSQGFNKTKRKYIKK